MSGLRQAACLVISAAAVVVQIKASLIIDGGQLLVEVPADLPDEVTALVGKMDTKTFSQSVLEATSKFKADPHAIAIVFKGSPLGIVPATGLQASAVSRWVLGSLTKLFGSLVGYEELESKTLFKDIYTGETSKESSYIGNYTAEGTDRYFGWHVENLAHPHMPHYVLMLCLRQDREKITETLLLPGEVVVRKLKPRTREVLMQKRFLLGVEDTLDLDHVGHISEAIPMLMEERSGGAWRINLDSTYVRPQFDDDIEAREALKELLEVSEDSFESVKLEVGDLIVWDNTRLAHDRQFTGSNRWIQRTHAFTMNVSPFDVFQGVPIKHMQGDEPLVLQTAGVFRKAVQLQEL